jgi:hypothetical protein
MTTGIKPNCEWTKINARWERESQAGPQVRYKTPSLPRLCCKCERWQDPTIANRHGGGFTCMSCLPYGRVN